jgi:hypothetical protein
MFDFCGHPLLRRLCRGERAVTFGSTSSPVDWHIIDTPCEPVLAGQSAVQLGIIQFDPQPEVYQPVQMIQCQRFKTF